MKKSTAFLAAMSLSLMASSASAADFFFSFTGNSGLDGASGSLSATLNADGTTYTATSGTITEFGPVAMGSGTLIPNPAPPGGLTSPSGTFFYDDQLLPGQNPLITNAGLLFQVGTSEINIWSNGPGPLTYTIYNQNGTTTNGTFALGEITAVPEPATWAMMLIGFGMIGFAARNRRQKVRVTYA